MESINKWRPEYLPGLKKLRKAMPTDEARAELATLEDRLENAVKDEAVCGTNEAVRSTHSEIVHRLNQLALDRLNVTFNKLCGIDVSCEPASSHGSQEQAHHETTARTSAKNVLEVDREGSLEAEDDIAQQSQGPTAGNFMRVRGKVKAKRVVQTASDIADE